jgi:hypothetical protein
MLTSILFNLEKSSEVAFEKRQWGKEKKTEAKFGDIY